MDKPLNSYLGGFAALVYTLTAAPTVSFWDCGEYIATAYKLQVPHPPGAPLFLLIGRLFSLLAGGDVTRVAFWVNMSSALTSAGAVMIVFWVLSLLGRQVLGKNAQKLSKQEALMVWVASGVGALSLTFCDTFWRNATEAETYASSTLVMVLVVLGHAAVGADSCSEKGPSLAATGGVFARPEHWATHR